MTISWHIGITVTHFVNVLFIQFQSKQEFSYLLTLWDINNNHHKNTKKKILESPDQEASNAQKFNCCTWWYKIEEKIPWQSQQKPLGIN